MERSVNEKIMRLNILPNQFYAALAIFSAPKRGGAVPPQNFRLGRGGVGYSPPTPPLSARPPLQLHLTEHVEVFPGMNICIVHSTPVLDLFCMVAHFLKNELRK